MSTLVRPAGLRAVLRGLAPVLLGLLALTAGPASPQATPRAGTAASGAAGAIDLPGLTPAERAWLAAHPEIRLGLNGVSPPWSYTVGDEYRGIHVDLIQRLSRGLGVRMEPVRGQSWSELLRGVDGGRSVDIIGLLPETPERMPAMRFTDPVATVDYALLVRAGESRMTELADLVGRRVAVVGSFSVRNWLERDYPGVIIVPTTSTIEALQKVSLGEVDGAVATVAGASWLLRDQGIVNLRVQHKLYRAPLSLGVRRDWPELVTVLNKAIAQLEPAEIDRITANYVEVRQGGYSRQELLAGLGVIVTLATIVLIVTQRRALVRERRLVGTLAQREREYRLLVDNSLDGVLRTEPGGRILAANPAACAMFGLSEPALLAGGFERIVDQGDPRLATLLQQRADTGRARGTLTLRRGDGTPFEAEVASALYDEADGRLLTSTMVRDVSERHRAEAARQQYEEQRRESQKLEAIGTLAGGIAHDFNNILGAIAGHAAMASADLRADGRGTPAAAASLGQIYQAADRARRLVQQILAFSRREVPQARPQRVAPVLRETVELLRATLPATVTLDLRLPEVPLTVRVEATQLQQLLLNLCTNAWQAMPEGTGRIEVRVDSQELKADEPEGLPPGGYVHLSVRDNGLGMDAATRARIFEPFFTTKAPGQGTGLGLAVVHGIVTGHGGAISVDSAPGRGACFDVWLPRDDSATDATVAAAEGAVPASPPPLPQGHGERVMYVDDDDVMRVMVEALLQRMGYQALCLSDATQAIEAMRSALAEGRPFAAVVTDHNMPGMSGIELIRSLRELAPGLPLLLSSGYLDEGLRAEARQAGAWELLNKERTIEDLGPALRRVGGFGISPAPNVVDFSDSSG